MTRMVVGQWSSEETSSWIVTRFGRSQPSRCFSIFLFFKTFRCVYTTFTSHLGSVAHILVTLMFLMLVQQWQGNFISIAHFYWVLWNSRMKTSDLTLVQWPMVPPGSFCCRTLDDQWWLMLLTDSHFPLNYIWLSTYGRHTVTPMGGTWWHRVLDQTVQDPPGQHPVVFSSYQDVVGSEYTQEGLETLSHIMS